MLKWDFGVIKALCCSLVLEKFTPSAPFPCHLHAQQKASWEKHVLHERKNIWCMALGKESLHPYSLRFVHKSKAGTESPKLCQSWKKKLKLSAGAGHYSSPDFAQVEIGLSSVQLEVHGLLSFLAQFPFCRSAQLISAPSQKSFPCYTREILSNNLQIFTLCMSCSKCLGSCVYPFNGM